MVTHRRKSAPVPPTTRPDGPRLLPVLDTADCIPALRALAEETRVRIVGLLMDHQLQVGEISRRLGISTYNASKHLRILREAGLLEAEKDGRRHLYALKGTVRRRAREGTVLDLGCCTFQFDEQAQAAKSAAPIKGRKRSA
jgi:DNA-binding transcriptional ArsR family regulator